MDKVIKNNPTKSKIRINANETKVNYYALLLAIVTHKTISQCLLDMGLSQGIGTFAKTYDGKPKS